MTIRTVLWAPEALKSARALPEHLRREVRDLLAVLATEPAPAENASADPDVPGAYHLTTPHVAVIAGIYDDEIRVWIVRADT